MPSLLYALHFARIHPAAVVAAVGLLLAACATPEPLPLPEPQPVAFGQGRIWQVDRPGLKSSYLFGTMHVSDPRVLQLPDAAETAFASAKIAAFEIDGTEELDENQQQAYVELPEDQSLQSVLGFWTYNRLRNLTLFRYGNHEKLNRLRPWVVWLLIADRDIAVDLKQDPHKPRLDAWLLQRARDAGKEVVGLETASEQRAIFGDLALDDQASMLGSAIDHYYSPALQINRVQLYLEGDLDTRVALWQRFLNHMEPGVAQRFHERINTSRNRIMVARMTPLFSRGSTFVSVGALHLPGEEGILRLLEQQGFTLTRLH